MRSLLVAVMCTSLFLGGVEARASISMKREASTTSVSKDQAVSSSSNSSFNSPMLATLHSWIVPNFDRHCMYATIELEIGTPPQTIHLAFDSGSFVPIVYDRSCTDPDCGTATGKYDSSASSSAKINTGKPINVRYGAGNTSGYNGVESFSITLTSGGDGGVSSSQNNNNNNNRKNSSKNESSSSIAMKKQGFTVINEVHWLSNQAGLAHIPTMSGIFGLAPGNFLCHWIGHCITDETTLSNLGIDLYAVKFPRGENYITESTGQVQFGGYDALNPEGVEPVWSPVLPVTDWWVVDIQNILINGEPTGAFNTSSGLPNVGLFDTGSGLLATVHADIPNVPTEVFNCSQLERSDVATHNLTLFPDVGIVIANTTFTLKPRDYIMRLPGTSGLCQSVLFLTNPQKKQDGDNLHQGDTTTTKPPKKKTPSPELDMGIMWTSRVTTIFDYKNYRMGFIQHE